VCRRTARPVDPSDLTPPTGPRFFFLFRNLCRPNHNARQLKTRFFPTKKTPIAVRESPAKGPPHYQCGPLYFLSRRRSPGFPHKADPKWGPSQRPFIPACPANARRSQECSPPPPPGKKLNSDEFYNGPNLFGHLRVEPTSPPPMVVGGQSGVPLGFFLPGTLAPRRFFTPAGICQNPIRPSLDTLNSGPVVSAACHWHNGTTASTAQTGGGSPAMPLRACRPALEFFGAVVPNSPRKTRPIPYQATPRLSPFSRAKVPFQSLAAKGRRRPGPACSMPRFSNVRFKLAVNRKRFIRGVWRGGLHQVPRRPPLTEEQPGRRPETATTPFQFLPFPS